MTESGVQVQQQLIGGGGGGSKKALLSKIKKLFVKPKVIKSSESLTRAGKDLKLKKSESLQNQKLSTGDKKYLKEIQKTPAFKKAQKEMEKPVPSGYGSKKNPNKKERELEKRFQKHKKGKK